MPTVVEGYLLEPHVDGNSRRLDASILRLDLARELEDLQQCEKWPDGHSAKTIVKYPALRVVLIAMKPGACLGEHHTTGQISLQTLHGRVRVKLANENVDLPVGILVALGASVPHDVEAVEQSVVLLTVAWAAPEK